MTSQPDDAPRLYLGNPAARYRGPGLSYAAMAAPRAWERGRVCPDGAPDVGALRLVQQGRLTIAEYGRLCGALFAQRRQQGRLSPGALCGVVSGSQVRLTSGDTLTCGCAAPGSPRRVHPCHLEVLAPELAAAGWEVVIWGEPLAGRTPVDFGWTR